MARVLSEDYNSWLDAFQEWTLPRSEAPESMIMWAGFYAIASVLKRKVSIPPDLLGSYALYPNLYVVYVAPPGVARKSTTAGYAQRLLEEITHINIASTATSASKLIQYMSEDTVDGSVSIISSELGSFMHVSEEDMYDVLTDIFDCPKIYKYSTRSHGTEVVQRPHINFLAATTPSWISEQMPEYVLGGGFASRCIFIYETKPRRVQMYYDIDYEQFEILEKALRHDLVHISQLEGQFRHDSPEVKDAMESWYADIAKKPPPSEQLAGYFRRKHIHVHKVAMILSVSRSDDLVITMDDFVAARQILDVLEESMPRVFSSVGRNPYSADIEKVREYVHDMGEVPHKKILARFYNDISKDALTEILSTLKIMGYIERNQNGKVVTWRATGQTGSIPSGK